MIRNLRIRLDALKRRLRYLKNDPQELSLLITDILLALGAFVLGIGALYAAFYL